MKCLCSSRGRVGLQRQFLNCVMKHPGLTARYSTFLVMNRGAKREGILPEAHNLSVRSLKGVEIAHREVQCQASILEIRSFLEVVYKGCNALWWPSATS